MLPCNLETDEGLGRNVGLGRQDGILLQWGLAEYLILLRLGIDPLASITSNCFSMSSYEVSYQSYPLRDGGSYSDCQVFWADCLDCQIASSLKMLVKGFNTKNTFFSEALMFISYWGII